MASLEVLLGVAAAVVLLGVLAVRVSVRLGLPSLLLYLGIGILLGESVLGIRFSDAGLTEAAGLGALVLILAEGGITTRWATVRPALRVGIALSTVSVVVSIAVVGTALHAALGLDWRTAFLWGAVLSSTDAAAVFSVLRGVGVSRRLRGALELESGMNDAPVVLAVVLLASDDPITWVTPVLVVYELLAGAVVGYALGRAGAWALRRAALPSTGLYPLAALAGLRARLLGAGSWRTRPGCWRPTSPRWSSATRTCRTGPTCCRSPRGRAGWRRSGCSSCSGSTPPRPRLIDAVVPGADRRGRAGGGRAPAVGDRWRPRRSGCRGASRRSCRGPGCAARCRSCWPSWRCRRGRRTGSGSSTPCSCWSWCSPCCRARRCRSSRAGWAWWRSRRARSRSTPPRWTSWVRTCCRSGCPQGSRLRGVYLRELRLPHGATVSLVVREEEAFTPTVDTRLRAGDQFLVVTTAAAREATERRIRAVDRAGRLARWHGESGH